MKSMYDSMVTATTGLGNFGELMKKEAEGTKKVADLIEQNTQVLLDAEKVVKKAQDTILDMNAKIESAQN